MRHNWTVVVGGRKHSFELYSNAYRFADQVAKGGHPAKINVGPDNQVMQHAKEGPFKVFAAQA